jgi:uncharacterized protein YhaN
MKIIQMDLKEFGIYHNVSWNPPDAGLIVLYGRNESGKTTLMKYVRSMFFGYLRGEWQGLFGHMDIRRDDGKEYRIYRNEKESYIVCGDETLHAEPSELWWHGLERGTYDKIFAMGLEDLQGFKILSNDEVRNHFFSVEGGERIGVARRDLSRLMSEALVASPQGKKPINVLLNEQRDFVQRLQGLSRQEEEFADLQSQEQETYAEEKRLRIDVAEVKQQIEQVSMTMEAWDVYQRGQEAMDQMQALADVAQFPQEGAQRWKNLEDKIVEIEGQIQQLNETGEGNSTTSPEWNRWIACGAQLDALFNKVQLWKQMDEEICQAGPKEEAMAEKRRELERQLGVWTDGIIPQHVAWDAGVTAATALSMADRELEKWEAAKPKRTLAVATPTNDAEPELTPDEWKSRDDGAATVQKILVERDSIVKQIQWLKQGPQEVSHTFFLFGLLLLAGAAGLAAGVLFYEWDQMTGFAGAGFCSVAALAAFAVQSSRSGKIPKQLQELEVRQAGLEGRLDELVGHIGLTVSSADEYPALSQQLDGMRKSYMDWQARQHQNQWERQQQAIYESLYQKWEKEGAGWKDKVSKEQKTWNAWTAIAHLPKLDPTHINDARQVWNQWRIVTESEQVWNDRKGNLSEQLICLHDDAEQVFRELGIQAPATAEEVEIQYHKWQDIRIQTEVAKEKEKQEERQQEQIDYWEKEKQVRRQLQEDLLKQTHSQTEGEFRSKILKFRQFQQYRAIYEQSESHLRLIAKNDKNLVILRRELKVHDMKTWEDELAHYEKKMEEYEKKLDAIAERRGSIVERLSQMAKSHSYTRTLQEMQNRATVLDAKLDVWMTQMFAQHMLGEAQSYYEQVRQPQVIRTAGEYLHKMTQGRYTLQASLDGRQLFAVDVNQRRVPEKQWSSGLGDQIYLSIRISLAMAFSSQIEPLPLILDDILVRFDEQRQQEALQFLAELGKTQQIFLFTCSAQTRRIAAQVEQQQDADTGVIHLYEVSRGTIQPYAEAAE